MMVLHGALFAWSGILAQPAAKVLIRIKVCTVPFDPRQCFTEVEARLISVKSSTANP
jgi:hypothetical protein